MNTDPLSVKIRHSIHLIKHNDSTRVITLEMSVRTWLTRFRQDVDITVYILGSNKKFLSEEDVIKKFNLEGMAFNDSMPLGRVYVTANNGYYGLRFDI